MKRGPVNTVESRSSEPRAFGRRGGEEQDFMMLTGGTGGRPPGTGQKQERITLAKDTTDIRKKSLTYSAIMHVVLFLFVVFGLPSLFDRTRDLEEQAITAEILPISTVSNVRPSAQPKPEEQQPTPPKPVSQPKPAKPTPPPPKPVEVQKPEPKAEPLPKPKEKPKAQEKPKEEPKEKPKAQEKPKEKPKEAPTLDQILKDIKAKADQQQPKQAQAVENPSDKPAKGPFNPTMPLSLSEKDAIRQQIQRHWNIPAGAKDAMNLVVLLNIKLNRDGTVRSVDVVDKGRYGSDSFFRAAADSAMRAVRQASPLQGLSQEKFDSWEELELNFDPKEMLY